MYRKEVNERSPMRVFESSMHGGLGRGNVGVVVSRAGKLLPKLLDFGIAKAVADSSELDEPGPISVSELGDTGEWSADVKALTQRGELMGSPHYMAPEQWLDPGAVSPR